MSGPTRDGKECAVQAATLPVFWFYPAARWKYQSWDSQTETLVTPLRELQQCDGTVTVLTHTDSLYSGMTQGRNNHPHYHHNHQHHALDSDDVSEEEKEEEEQKFRLCPHLELDGKTGCSLFWRLLTLVLCLPLCYPCYLTRKTRWPAQWDFRVSYLYIHLVIFDNHIVFYRQYQSARERTPKRLYRGTCRHDHSGDISSLCQTPILSRSQSSLSSPCRKDKEVQKLNILLLFSDSYHSLKSSVTLEPSQDKSEGLIGTKTSVVEDISFDMSLYQEFPQRRLSQEMLLSSINILVLIFSSHQDLTHQGKQTWFGTKKLTL